MSKTHPLCLLSGASGGIGEAIALELASQGYTLILTARDTRKLTALSNQLPGEHYIFSADLTEPTARHDLLSFCAQLGELDLVVNCAGTSQFGAFVEGSYQDIEHIFNVNVTAVMALNQLLLQQAKQRPLILVNVGSALGAIGHPGYVNYCASKFALRGFTEALAREYSGSNKRIKYLAPRATKTAINSQQVNDMNSALGNQVDEPQVVAKALVALINSNKRRLTLGWPERLFVRLNGALPEVVDNALGKKLKKIKTFFQPSLEKLS